jgi:hypothetical protein
MEEMAASKSRWRAGGIFGSGVFGSVFFSAFAGIGQLFQILDFRFQIAQICTDPGCLVNAGVA